MMDDKKIMDGSCMHEHKIICLKRISWSAIFVGALVGLGLSFLLNLFSVAIGLTAFITNASALTLAIGGFIGLLIGVIVAMFVAGYTAGYLGKPYCAPRNLGVMYGFTAWCVALLLGVIFSTHMGHYVSAYSNFITHPRYVVVMEADTANAQPTTSAPTARDDNKSGTVMVDVETQRTGSGLAMGAFIIFILFFVGALASCIGGHCGMATCCKKETCH